MVQCLDGHDTARASTSGVFADMNGGLGVYAESEGAGVRIGQRVQVPNVLEDGIGLSGFFWTLLLATVRSRYSWRFSRLEIVRTVGKEGADQPF